MGIVINHLRDHDVVPACILFQKFKQIAAQDKRATVPLGSFSLYCQTKALWSVRSMNFCPNKYFEIFSEITDSEEFLIGDTIVSFGFIYSSAPIGQNSLETILYLT